MSEKLVVRLIGLLLWVSPMVAYSMLNGVLHGGASWLWWLPILTIAIGFNAVLDWYVWERVKADLTDEVEA